MNLLSKAAILALIVLAVAFAPFAGAVASPSTYADEVKQLRVAKEDSSGYDRGLFDYAQKTRQTILAQESTGALVRNENGTITEGVWWSPWNDMTYTDADELDVDHTVALAEAWSSGARDWSDAKRKTYANDVTNPFTLNAISSQVNRGPKSDNDPAEWLPEQNRCLYVREWTETKLIWGLSADKAEVRALTSAAAVCDAAANSGHPPAPGDDGNIWDLSDLELAGVLFGGALTVIGGSYVAGLIVRLRR